MEFKFEDKKKSHIQFEQSSSPYVEVYIAVSFFCHGGDADFPLKLGNFANFSKNFDFATLAKSINKLSNDYDLKAGINDKEVVSFVNQHRHHELMSIVKVQVARDSLIYREPGKSYNTQTFRAGDRTLFFMIKQGTHFSVENIISARAMRHEDQYLPNPINYNYIDNPNHKYNEYWNSFRQGTYPESFWPKGLTVDNPSYVNQLELIKQVTNTNSNFFKPVPSCINNSEVNLECEALNNYLSKCSKNTREYILSFKGKPKLSDRIQDLALTAEEEDQFEKFKDNVVTMDYINMPVVLNENCYDITTLIKQTRDPISNEEFSPLEISSCRKLMNAFEEAVKELQVAREVKNLSSKF